MRQKNFVIEFLTENPDGAIDVENVLAVCHKCGTHERIHDLSMYLPKKNISPDEKNNHGRWSVAMPFENANYVAPDDLEENYTLFAKYPHRCKNCGGEVEIYNETNIKKLKCPKCNSPMLSRGNGHWD